MLGISIVNKRNWCSDHRNLYMEILLNFCVTFCVQNEMKYLIFSIHIDTLQLQFLNILLKFFWYLKYLALFICNNCNGILNIFYKLESIFLIEVTYFATTCIHITSKVLRIMTSNYETYMHEFNFHLHWTITYNN